MFVSKNILGGVTIFWDKPFQINDFVDVKGKLGTVSEVGLRTTRIRTVGGTTIVIPNSHVADSMLEPCDARAAPAADRSSQAMFRLPR